MASVSDGKPCGRLRRNEVMLRSDSMAVPVNVKGTNDNLYETDNRKCY